MPARPEVTGRRVFESASPASPPVAFTVKEFCEAHRISVSYYYELKKLGRAPREMMFGTRRIISAEAAAAWRAENTVEPTS
jgi:hypothetical protein